MALYVCSYVKLPLDLKNSRKKTWLNLFVGIGMYLFLVYRNLYAKVFVILKTRHIYRQFRVVLITICWIFIFLCYNKATICFLKVICIICFETSNMHLEHK